MNNKTKKTTAAFALAILLCAACSSPDHALKVNTLIGNGGDGLRATFLYPGATYPFGMVQFTPTFKEPNIGFTGFQLSGVGCYSLGQFPVLPQAGEITESPSHMFNWKENITDKKGHAGYFECTADNEIHTEMSVTPRTGMAVMTPSASCGDISMALGVGFEISNGDFGSAEAHFNPDGSFEGHAVAHDFCSAADTPFDIYYYAEFDRKPKAVGAWFEDQLMPGETAIEGRESGLYCTFDGGKPLKYKFAMSFVSMENAKDNLRTENPGWNFRKVRRSAEKAWEKYLSMIEVNGSDNERVEQFYTHLYHALIHPSLCSDVCGEYMGSDFKVHKVEDGHKAYHMFSNWDTYRTQIQLVSLLAPDVASDIVRSHLGFAEQCGGGMPRWSMANYETNVMQGDPGALICCNAYAFGARDYDVRRVADVLYRAAEDSTLMTQVFPARPDLGDYLKYGRCHPSMTLEYCLADFGISRFALEACKDTLKAEEYLRRSGNWKNVFNYDTKWVQGRNHDGSYRDWHASWNEFQEASHVIYHWMVPHDMRGLVKATGGSRASEARLDYLFERLDDLYDGDRFAACNEPGFGVPWSYNWVSRPDKTTEVVHRILTEVYSTGMDGVPGNDDLGAMGSWYVFACLGMYPSIPGVGGFSVNTPIFDDITIHLPGGDVRIKGGSGDLRFIDRMWLNGLCWDQPWIPFDMIREGAEIVYETSTEPGMHRFGELVPPPSFPSDGDCLAYTRFSHEFVTDQGISREYYLYVPEKVREDRPLVYCLHGYGGYAVNTLHVLRETAEKECFILCVPQASFDPNKTNGWIVGYPPQEGAEIDDVEFLRNLTGKLVAELGVSKDKVFVTGMSNGGEMCYLLAHRGTDFVRAVAPISGLEMEWAYRSLEQVKAMPLMEAHGTIDMVSKWNGDPEDKDGWGKYIGVPQAVNFWAAAARCTHEVVENIPSKNDHEIILHRYVGGDDGVEVWLYEVKGGDHGWFSPEMNIGEQIWRFFSMYL